MKKYFYILLVISPFLSFSQGVAIVSVDSIGNTFETLLLIKSSTNVQIINQISTVTSSQVFLNTTQDTLSINFAFPLHENAAATKIRWKADSFWNNASLIGAPQDSSFNSDSGNTTFVPTELDMYLGQTPLYFPVQFFIVPGSKIEIELTYVELLSYLNSKVKFNYPGNYSSIQENIDSLALSIHIESYRNIIGIETLTYDGWNVEIQDSISNLSLALTNIAVNDDFKFEYELAPDSGGFFAFSTFYPDSSEKCDTLNGFFTFIIEPSTLASTEILPKDFVLILDVSGSMEGAKIEQAKQAAIYILNNFNMNDRFNLVKFSDSIVTYSNDFNYVSSSSILDATNFVDSLYAGGSTNISGSFDIALPLFINSLPDRVKSIIFITDGDATVGITGTSELLSHVQNLRNTFAPDATVNVLGIGQNLNDQLLNQLAFQNAGLYSNITDIDNLSSIINDFYTSIQSPILLNTQITFSPNIVSEVYPNPIPYVFQGQQLIISGRYNEPSEIIVTLSGNSGSEEITINYSATLGDSLISENEFLTKIWTKKKINYLINQYYSFGAASTTADSIKNIITRLSVCRGVVSPFTSFYDDGVGIVGLEELSTLMNTNSQLIISPNPASDYFSIKIPNKYIKIKTGTISIFNSLGQCIYIDGIKANSGNIIELNLSDVSIANGIYFVTLQFEDTILSSRFIFYK